RTLTGQVRARSSRTGAVALGSNGQGPSTPDGRGAGFVPAGGGGGGFQGGGLGGAGSPLFPVGAGDCDQAFGLDQRFGSFGGATGFYQLITPNGTVCLASHETAAKEI